MRSFKAVSSIFSPSWMSMARLTFPSRLELNRPEGSFNAAPLANVILTTLLYVSPVQTMPPCEKTGVPGDFGLTHFHSSTISGSAACMISRTFASVFPRQSASSLIFSSINPEADSTGVPNNPGVGLLGWLTGVPVKPGVGFVGWLTGTVLFIAFILFIINTSCIRNCPVYLGRSLRNKSSNDMAFPHPKSRKDHYRNEDIPCSGGVVWNLVKRTINIPDDRNGKDDVNPAKNRTLNALAHGSPRFTSFDWPEAASWAASRRTALRTRHAAAANPGTSSPRRRQCGR